MRVAVTGANGLVGSRLCLALAAAGHQVVGLGRGPRRAEGAFEYQPCDLSDAGALRAAVDAAAPDAVVNAGAMTDVDGCERAPEEAWATNAEAPATLAKAARARGFHLVHVSTDYVFDGDAGPYAEDAVPNPRGAYALGKHAGELAVRTLAPSWAVARTAVVYGWPPAGRPNFGSWLVGALEKGQSVKLFADQHVSPSLADSVAAMLAELAVRRLHGVFHAAGAEVVDRVTFGKKVCALFGFDQALVVPTRLAEAKLASPRPLRAGLKVDRAAQELTAKPLGLDEALGRFHRAWRAGR